MCTFKAKMKTDTEHIVLLQATMAAKDWRDKIRINRLVVDKVTKTIHDAGILDCS